MTATVPLRYGLTAVVYAYADLAERPADSSNSARRTHSDEVSAHQETRTGTTHRLRQLPPLRTRPLGARQHHRRLPTRQTVHNHRATPMTDDTNPTAPTTTQEEPQ
jgi:hypothetical protein